MIVWERLHAHSGSNRRNQIVSRSTCTNIEKAHSLIWLNLVITHKWERRKSLGQIAQTSIPNVRHKARMLFSQLLVGYSLPIQFFLSYNWRRKVENKRYFFLIGFIVYPFPHVEE